MLREFLRQVLKNRTVRKRLPESLGSGTVVCSPEAMLSVVKWGWQSDQAVNLFRWAEQFCQAGMTVWDVGANQGLFAFASSYCVGTSGTVLALEPDPFLVALIERSIATGTHRGGVICVLPIALAERVGVSDFAIASTDRALNHLVTSQGNPRAGGNRQITRVVTVTVDWLAEQTGPPDLIKIDVEGAEKLVMQGASHVLEHDRPVLIVEVAPENSDSMIAALNQKDYVMLNPVADRPALLSVPSWNTLAVPSELLDSVRSTWQ